MYMIGWFSWLSPNYENHEVIMLRHAPDRKPSAATFARTIITLLALLAPVAVSSCSLALDHDTAQCRVDADCRARGAAFDGLLCGPQGVCVKEGGCSTNQDCITANNGEPYICRASDRACISLKSPECPLLQVDAKDLANDETIWLGGMTVLASLNPDEIAYAVWNENTTELARRDFRDVAGWLPPSSPGKPRRPIGIVYCDDTTSPDIALKAAHHLVDDVKVPAMFCCNDSSTLIDIAQKVTIPAGVLIASPANASPLITSLDTHNPRLVWRFTNLATEPNIGLSVFVPQVLEPKVRAIPGLLQPTDPIRVALLGSSQAGPNAAANVVFSSLKFNNGKTATQNGANFKQFNYGDPTAADFKAAAASTVATLITFRPHVVIFLGETTELTDTVGAIEAKWPPAEAFKPFYASDDAIFPAIYDVVGTNVDFRHRFFGTTAWIAPGLIDTYTSRYQAAFKDGSPPPSYIAGGYDAFYELAYSISTIGSDPVDGVHIARGLEKLLPPGQPINVGFERIFDAFAALGAGRRIDFTGAVGPLDFDPNTGDAAFDASVFCLDVDTTGKASKSIDSGMIYHALTKTLDGTLTCP